MLNFNPIELSDKALINNCLQYKMSRSCDYCFANLFAWQARFKTEFVVVQETLFVKFEDGGTTFYMFPCGKLPLQKAFEMLQKDAVKRNIPLKIKAVSEEMWQKIQEEIPEKFVYLSERENFEYLYTAEKLRFLAGSKMQAKRNHINRFKRENPNWEFCLIQTREDCYDCWTMLKEWEQENAATIEPSFYYDYLASELMLKHFDLLELQGGMIKNNGKIVAFSVGEPLTDDTFVVHVEKAHRDMNGAYSIINQQIAENVASNFHYINREEDMGLEQLRKAKLSYQPDMVLQEGIAVAE